MIRPALGPTSNTPVGTPIGLGCQVCELLELCGGTFSTFDCLSGCCNAPDKCTMACPRSRNFTGVVRDAGGLDGARSWSISQATNDLPSYIPHIHNGSGRNESLPSPYVALTTFDVVSRDSEKVFSTPYDLRQHFRVSRDARVLLLSVGKDNRLEQYWRWSAARAFAQYLATLGVAHVTAPNFSFPLDVPRPEHLVNKMRSLKCAEQLSAAGLSVIPHLNAFNQKDWDCWRDFLRDHADITMVAQEFQTGLASRTRASWHIWQLCNIEEALGRSLHLIAIAGRRHLPLVIGMAGITVVDSVPFMRACNRRSLDKATGKWVVKLTDPGAPIDDLLHMNVAEYSRAVKAAIRALRQVGPLLPESKRSAAEGLDTFDEATLPASGMQLWLWPAAAREQHHVVPHGDPETVTPIRL